MNGTELIPKYAIAFFPLRNQWFVAGYPAVVPYKQFAIQAQVPANIVNFRFSQVGAAIPFAAVSATLTAE